MVDITEKLKRLKVCLVLPTYNNAGTLAQLMDALCAYTTDIIVVNDGSTDSTSEILDAYVGRITVVSYTVNRGKGYALKQGFAEALARGFDYALTMDTDGQHRTEDLVGFLTEAECRPGALIVGSRLLKQRHMPGGNTFANRFSNFWFCIQTGIHFPDTQSGYRLYPLQRMRKMRICTNRYECELEMLVKAAWRGIPLKAIPVDVYYAPPGERITHFRPFRDFARISVLNTFLVFGAVVYGYPNRLYRWMIRRKP